MNRLVQNILLISLLLALFAGLSAQDFRGQDELQRQLLRLRDKLQQAHRLAQLFPNDRLTQIVQEAEKQYNLAREAVAMHRPLKARAYLKAGFVILSQILRELKNNPFLRTRFKEILDQRIQEAEGVVWQSQNPEARKLLNRARFYRQRVVSLSGSDRLELATKQYFLAIYFADNAIKTARGQTVDSVTDLDRYFEDSESLYMQVRDMAALQDRPLVKEILQRAEEGYRKARRLYDDHRPREAFQRLQVVNRLLYRVLSLMEGNDAALAERLGNDLDGVEESLRNIQSEIGDNPEPIIRRLYERLLFLSASARQKYQAQNYAGARQQVNIANRLLLQLHRRLNKTGVPSESRIREQIQTAEFMLNSLRNNPLSAAQYQTLLNLLAENLEKAKQAVGTGKNRLAVHHLTFFNSLALKLDQMRTANNKEDTRKDIVKEELNRLGELLASPPSSGDADNLSTIRFQNAHRLYEIAKKAFEKKNYRFCRQMVKLALNSLTK